MSSDALSRHDSGYGSVDLSKPSVAGLPSPPLIKIEFVDPERDALEGELRALERERRGAELGWHAGRRMSGLVVTKGALAAEQKRVSLPNQMHVQLIPTSSIRLCDS